MDQTDQPKPGRGRRRRRGRRMRLRIMRHIRAYFFAGVLVTAPIAITFYLAWLIINWIDGKITPLIPAAYNPETYLPFGIPGLGLIISFVLLTLIGAMAAGAVGRFGVKMTERLLARMPVIRSVYSATKQIFETVLRQQSTAFRQVVLFEYPRRGSWAIGFITGKTLGEVQNVTSDEVVNVFLPTTPEPHLRLSPVRSEKGVGRPQHDRRGGNQDGRLRRHRDAGGSPKPRRAENQESRARGARRADDPVRRKPRGTGGNRGSARASVNLTARS